MHFRLSDKSLIVIASLLLVLILMGKAEGAENFKVFKGESLGALCPGSTGLITTIVENSGNQIIDFSVSMFGSASGFATLVPTGFSLMPGEEKVLYIYISPRTTSNIGSYNLNVIIQGGSETESVENIIQIRDCFDFSVGFVDNSKNICPGENERFDFEIKNLGDYDEVYLLSADGPLKDKIALSQDLVSIRAGEVKKVFAFASPPVILDENFFSVSAKAQTTRTVKGDVASLVVDPCFDFKVSIDNSSHVMCERSESVSKIKIKNLGSSANRFDLVVQGPLWANVERNSVDLGVNEEEEINLLFSPDYGVEGNFEVLLKVKPLNGDFESITSFNINIRKCHGVIVSIDESSDKICGGLGGSYNVLIKNIGEFEKEFLLGIIGPEWASINIGELDLDKNEESVVDLEVNPGLDVIPGEYDVGVVAQAADSSKVSSMDTIRIGVVDRLDCYLPNIRAESRDVSVNFDSSVTVPVLLENLGSNDATYELGVSGSASSFAQLNPSSLTIEKGKSEIIYLYVSPSSQVKDGDYVASLSVRLGDSGILASEDVRIRVKESSIRTQEELLEEGGGFWRSVKNFFSELFSGENVEEKQEEEVEKQEEIEKEIEDAGEESVGFWGSIKNFFNQTSGEIENIEEEQKEEVEGGIEEPQQGENISFWNRIKNFFKGPPGDIEEKQEKKIGGEMESGEIAEDFDIDLDSDINARSKLREGEFIQMKIGDKIHRVIMEKSEGNTVTLLFQSEEFNVVLNLGENLTIDVDGDDIDDIIVGLNGFDEEGKADIYYQKLNEEGEEIVLGDKENVRDEVPIYKNTPYLIILIVIIVIIVLFVIRKRIVNFFTEEDIKEGEFEVRKEEDKKIGDNIIVGEETLEKAKEDKKDPKVIEIGEIEKQIEEKGEKVNIIKDALKKPKEIADSIKKPEVKELEIVKKPEIKEPLKKPVKIKKPAAKKTKSKVKPKKITKTRPKLKRGRLERKK